MKGTELVLSCVFRASPLRRPSFAKAGAERASIHSLLVTQTPIRRAGSVACCKTSVSHTPSRLIPDTQATTHSMSALASPQSRLSADTVSQTISSPHATTSPLTAAGGPSILPSIIANARMLHPTGSRDTQTHPRTDLETLVSFHTNETLQ